MTQASRSLCYAKPCCAEHHIFYCYAECCNAEFHNFIVMLNETFFIVMPSAFMLHIVMLSVMELFNLVKNPIVLANTIWPYRGIFIKSYW